MLKDFDDPEPEAGRPAEEPIANPEPDLELEAEVQIELENPSKPIEANSVELAAATPSPQAQPKPVAKPTVSGPQYQPAELLSKRRTHGQEPAYPRAARLAQREGSVLVRLTISPEGKVQAYRFLRSAPLFDAAVSDVLGTWRFSPHLVDGEPVATFTVYRFLFKMD